MNLTKIYLTLLFLHKRFAHTKKNIKALLDNKLSSRICSHYRKGNFQFVDFESNKFFDWFANIKNENFETYDEQTFFFNIHTKKGTHNLISLLKKILKL